MPFRTRILVAAAAAAFTLGALDASAASDYLLKIDGIEGESTLKGFEKQIEIQSWSWGVSQSAAGNGGGRAGKSCPSDVSFSKGVDKATPPLIAGAAGGTVSPNAILIGLRQTGNETGAPETYLKIEMKNVLVTSYQTSGAYGSVAMDAFSLKFTSATVSYYPQLPNGKLGTPVVTSLQGC